MTMYRKKPKVLRRKNVQKKTGAKSQAKQIMALSRQVDKLRDNTSTRFTTFWQRNILPIDDTTDTGKAFVCPIPYAPCNPFNSLNTGTSRVFSDNIRVASQPSYVKTMLFTAPDSIKTCSKIYCNGGTIKWQMSSNEPAYSKVTLALIQPMSDCADQLTNNRGLKENVTGGAPGSAASMVTNVDYTRHSGAAGSSGQPTTFFGTLFNRKLWKVLYYRECAFSSPGATDPDQSTPISIEPANTEPKNNAVVQCGTIRLPKAGLIQNRNQRQDGDSSKTVNAIETGYVGSKNERECYLVAVNNGAAIDGEVISLGFRVLNNYVATN